MPVVKIINLTKDYGRFRAVDRLNLTIHDREIFGLLGPNGAGKTTTILMLATVLKPTAGTAKVGGFDIVREPDKVRTLIGIAFQDPKALWVDKPIEILEWHGRICGLSGQKLKERVKEVMDRLDIWDLRNKMFYELSGGNRKRVEIAKVFVQQPKLAIFDEPTAQVDVIGKHVIWDMIKELRDEGSTVIIATNDMSEADMMSDRIGIMSRGRLVAVGAPEELKDRIPGGDIVELELSHRPDNGILEIIKGYGGVQKIYTSDRNMKVYLNRGEEVAPLIVEEVLKRGYRILNFKIKEPSLDEVFFYFTGTRLESPQEERVKE